VFILFKLASGNSSLVVGFLACEFASGWGSLFRDDFIKVLPCWVQTLVMMAVGVVIVACISWGGVCVSITAFAWSGTGWRWSQCLFHCKSSAVPPSTFPVCSGGAQLDCAAVKGFVVVCMFPIVVGGIACSIL